MTLPLSDIAAAVGSPHRAAILGALLDGRAWTAQEVAADRGLAKSTVSHHLDRLERAGWVVNTWRGRHRYVALKSPEVAEALESLLGVVPSLKVKVEPALAAARTCYSHLAGYSGVMLAQALLSRGLLVDRAGSWQGAAHPLWQEFGIALDLLPTSRPHVRVCLDWTERRSHLGGWALGFWSTSLRRDGSGKFAPAGPCGGQTRRGRFRTSWAPDPGPTDLPFDRRGMLLWTRASRFCTSHHQR